jgi:hypothetical protein
VAEGGRGTQARNVPAGGNGCMACMSASIDARQLHEYISGVRVDRVNSLANLSIVSK